MSTDTTNILIVDDNPVNLRTLQDILERRGFQVQTAKDGTTALSMAMSGQWDLFLLDIGLPDIDGYEICRRFKSEHTLADIPVIFISMMRGQEDIAKGFAQGGLDYITKPFYPEEVIARINAHVDLRHAQKQLARQNEALRQRLKAYKKIEKSLRLNEERLESLLRLSWMKNESEQEVASFALEEGVRLTESKIGYLHFMNVDQNSLHLYLWSRKTLQSCTAQELSHYPLSEAGIWADCVRKRAPVIHNDYAAAEGKKELPNGHVAVHRHMSVPIFDSGAIVAVAGVGNKETDYNSADIRQLNLFMNSMWDIFKRRKTEIELEKTYEELKRLAASDPLTKVANRFRFDEYINREWRRMARNKTPLSLIFCDIDHFKRYNDAYGHLAGDDCLLRVATAIQEVVRRPADLVARYGGEEFVVILPETDLNGAMHVAHSIRSHIEEMCIPHEASPTGDCLTTSLGVSSVVPSRLLPYADLIHAADLALYEAKENGRNCVCSKETPEA